MIEEAPAGSDFIVLPETVWPYAYDERYLPQAPVVTKIREILREKSSGAMIVTGAETIVYYPPEEQTETARQNERGAFTTNSTRRSASTRPPASRSTTRAGW